MRSHFAHRSDSKCPLNSKKSAEELEAQALIYQHLEQNCDHELAIDVVLEEEQQPIDILVGYEKSYQRAFFFLSRDRRNLYELLEPAKSRNIPVQIIYTQSRHALQDELLKLSKQQIDHAWHSKRYDPHQHPNYGHLYFLDTEDSTFHIYRGLKPSNKCRLYCSEHQQSISTSELKIDEFGELYTDADESERISRSSEAVEPVAIEHKPQPIDIEEPEGGIYPWEDESKPQTLATSQSSSYRDEERREEAVRRGLESFAQPLRCEDCGTMTTEWNQAQPSRGTCVCNKCIGVRHREGKDDYDW